MTNVFNITLVHDDQVEWEQIDPKIKRKIMSYSDEIMLVKVAFLKGGIGVLHHHPHLQMSYVAEGIFEITMGDEVKTLKTGDVYFAPSNLPHGAVCLEDGLLIDVFSPYREDFL